jgi:hypothetical protein
MVIFLHIPKTAGSTVYENVVKLNRGKTKIYSDHYPYGVHRLINKFLQKEKKAEYFTWMRDPIERALSHFRYMCSHAKRGPKFCSVVGDTYLHAGEDAALKRAVERGAISDIMTRQISGQEGADNLYVPIDNMMRFRIYNPFSTEPKDPPQYDLETAKGHLGEMVFVGFQSRMDRDVDKLCERFRWKRPKRLRDIHVAKKDNWPDVLPEPTETQLNLIRSVNQNDIELYNYAKELWW